MPAAVNPTIYHGEHFLFTVASIFARRGKSIYRGGRLWIYRGGRPMRPASVKAVAQKAQRSPIAVFTYKYVVFRVSLPVSLSASATPSHRRPNKSAPPSLFFRRTLSVVLARTSLPLLPSHPLPPRRPSSPSVGRARWRPTPVARTEAPTAGRAGPQRVAQGHGVVRGHSGARDGGAGHVGDGGARGGGAGRVEPRR